MGDPKISVICPVYMAEKYLCRCIDSILVQTFADFELLLIVDGSPDNSKKICDYYERKDKRIRVFYKKNGGANSARRYGVSKAKGEWTVFVDSDDTITKDALQRLSDKAKSSGSDVVVAAWNKVSKNHKRLIPLCSNGTHGKDYYIKSLLLGHCYSGPVAKLFKTKLLTDDVFNMPNNISNHEDLIMNLRIANNIEKIIFCPKVVIYNYYDNDFSVSKSVKDFDYWNKVFELVEHSLYKQFDSEFYTYKINIYYLYLFKKDISMSKEATKDFFNNQKILKECNFKTRSKLRYMINGYAVDKFLLFIISFFARIKKILLISIYTIRL